MRKKEACICVWNERSARSRATTPCWKTNPAGTTEVALALLPDGVREGMVLIFENFEYRIKE